MTGGWDPQEARGGAANGHLLRKLDREVAGMRHIFLGLSLFFSVAGVFQQSPGTAEPVQQPSVSLPPELARVLTDYERAWSKGDSAGLAELFAEDGFVLSRENPAVRGRTAIGRFYSGPGGPLSLRAIAFAT